jgi:K+-transporting ATPase ATPase A chain
VSTREGLQILLFFLTVTALTPPLGSFIASVVEGRRTFLHPALGWLERLFYGAAGVDPSREMDWKAYAKAVAAFSVVSLVVLIALQMLQGGLPFNPTALPNVSWHLAFNTAASFITNTDWQSYGGESTMSRLTQFAGLAVQNFVSAAVGIAVVVALIRGLRARAGNSLGNFWADLVRLTVYLFLPLSFVFAFFLVAQGVPQTFAPDVKAKTLEGAEQVIAVGPVASQEAIKQLGTNGGGYFNVNSAHPYENPTPWADWLEMVAILLIPSALCWTYGVMVGKRSQGAALLAAMALIFLASLSVALWAEYQPNASLGTKTAYEGKEIRFGTANSVAWGVASTVTSNGSVNSMHESWRPLSGMMAIGNILLGEIVYGGVGSGLYGMLAFVLLTVFMAGLMVGRSPEALGKKVEAREVKLVVAILLLPNAAVLLGSSLAVLLPQGLSSLNNAGPHGLSEILYAFASAGQNNGSAFAGINANTPFYNVSMGLTILVGRFAPLFAALAIGGSMAGKKVAPPGPGTFATDTPTFVALLCSIIVIVGVLTYLPAFSLGPIVEHLLMLSGRTF